MISVPPVPAAAALPRSPALQPHRLAQAQLFRLQVMNQSFVDPGRQVGSGIFGFGGSGSGPGIIIPDLDLDPERKK